MPRLLFEKTGNAVWISHLDLMRLFQRAFKRADLPLKHTQGFNPRPSVSIALPLSVGVESQCELLDFDLDGVTVPDTEICQRLNDALITGVRVLQVYGDGRALKNLAYLRCCLRLEYSGGVPEAAAEALRTLYASPSLLVEKKGKNGVSQQDINPLLRELEITQPDPDTLSLEAVICCQNPALNPAQLCAAIEVYLPQYAPAHTRCKRLEIYDTNGNIFR